MLQIYKTSFPLNNFIAIENVFTLRCKIYGLYFFCISKKTFFIELVNSNFLSFREFTFEQTVNTIFFFPWYINEIDLHGTVIIDNNILKFLSENKIFLSSDTALNDFMYYKHVIQLNEHYKKENPNDFILLRRKDFVVNKWDSLLWSEIPHQTEWYYFDEEYFVYYNEFPFDRNELLNKSVDSLMYPYDPIDWWLGSELKSYNWEEPFFFFWKTIKQPMLDYWLISSLRHWSIFFEETVFWNPFSWHTDPTHTFPHLSWWAHPKELKLGFKAIWRSMDYFNDTGHLNILKYFSDLQEYMFDKNYIYLWHYFNGARQEMDFYVDYEFTTYYQQLRMQLHNPVAHLASKYTTLANSYNALYEKSFYLAIFPDNVIPWSYTNILLDYETAGYTWFFSVGFTFLDWLELLELWRYQAANIVWEDFELFVEDYGMYQSIYMSEQTAAIRTALIVMLFKDVWSAAHLWTYITNYGYVFGFFQIPEYWEYLNSKRLYPLSKIKWLDLFRDDIPIEYRLSLSEWLACTFHGYNVSLHLMNHSGWYVELWQSPEFLEQIGMDMGNDEYYETLENHFLESLTTPLLLKPSPSTMFISYNYKNYNFTHNIYLKYLNEKFLDDVGYFFTSFMRGEAITNKSKLFSFGSFWHIEHSPVIQYLHTSWLKFYQLGYPLNFFWFLKTPIVFDPDYAYYKWHFDTWVNLTFEIDYSDSLIWEGYLFSKQNNVVNFACNAQRYVGVYFYVWLDTIFGLFCDINKILGSNFFLPINMIMGWRSSFFEIISTEDAIFYLTELKYLLTDKYSSFFVIKIFDEPLKSYFDFIYCAYKSPEIQYLIDLIFIWTIVWNWPLISVSAYKYENFPYTVAALNYVDCSDKPLAMEFWIPFLIWPIEDWIIIDPHVISLPFDINLSDYFVEKNISQEEYMEKIMMSFILHELNWFDQTFLSDLENFEFLVKMSWVVNFQYRFEGFDWYANYVLKHNLYELPKLTSGKIISQDSNEIVDKIESYDDWFLLFLENVLEWIYTNYIVCFIKTYVTTYDYHGMSDKDIDNFIYFLWK